MPKKAEGPASSARGAMRPGMRDDLPFGTRDRPNGR